MLHDIRHKVKCSFVSFFKSHLTLKLSYMLYQRLIRKKTFQIKICYGNN